MSASLGRRRALRRLANLLGLKRLEPQHYELLDLALTHDSYVAAAAPDARRPANERLEFLGDAILGAIAAESLYRRYPDKREGELSPLRASLVSRAALAQTAQRIDLGPLLLLGKGEERSGGARRPSILAAALEAVIGALYVIAGFEAARSFVEREHLERSSVAEAVDPKTALQEYAQAKFKDTPRYTLTAQRGPAHERSFEVAVAVRGQVIGSGDGSSKKQAEVAAARQALQRLRSHARRI